MPVPVQPVTFTASIANGVTTTFPFSFMIGAPDDLAVTINGQKVTTGFSVFGVVNPAGGTVEFVTPPASGAKILCYLDPVLKRETDYQQFGDWSADVVDNDFDRIWLALQFLKQNDLRAIKLPFGTSVDQIITEDAASRAGKGFKFDANGNIVISQYDPDAAQTAGAEAAAAAISASASAASAAAALDNFDDRYLGEKTSDPTLDNDGNPLQSGALYFLTPRRVMRVYTGSGWIDAMTGISGESVSFLPTGGVDRSVQDKLRDTVSLKDFGAKCDGTTDDTVAVQAAITAIGSTAATLLIPGPTKISAALTFGWKTELQFSANGSFAGVAGTELLQVQRQIVAGPHTCFSSCVPMATTGMTVLPEWFGALGDGATDDKAAIQKSIDFLKNTGGVVQFDARTYAMSANVNIGTGSAGSTGQNTILQGKGQNSTKLMTTGAAATAIQILGAAGTPLQGVSIRDLSITKSVAGTGGYGIYAQYTAALKLRDVQVAGYLIGVSLLRATNTLSERVTVNFSGAANNWRGFELNGGGTGAGGNASSVFRDCWVDGTQASGTGGIGFFAFGSYVSDLLFDACEVTTVDIGFEFDCSASVETGNEDVQMINCRVDMIKTYGLFIDRAGFSGANSSMFHIIGGWFNHRSNLAESVSIYLNQCRGVVIKGVQLVCFANWAYAYHVKMASCSNVIISECLFTDMKYGVYATSPGYCQITANRFYCQSGRSASNFIVMSGAARVMVTDNIFDGYAANAVSIDDTSSGCGIVGNCANISNITSRFSNSGSGPVGGTDGSTGLNSGV